MKQEDTHLPTTRLPTTRLPTTRLPTTHLPTTHMFVTRGVTSELSVITVSARVTPLRKDNVPYLVRVRELPCSHSGCITTGMANVAQEQLWLDALVVTIVTLTTHLTFLQLTRANPPVMLGVTVSSDSRD